MRPEQRAMRPVLFAIVTSFVLLAASYAVAVKIIAPRMIITHLTDGAARACENCELKIGHLDTFIFEPGRLVFHEVCFKGGDPKTTSVRTHIAQVEINLLLVPLLQRRMQVRELALNEPYIELLDGPKHSPPSHSPQVIQVPVQFEIEKTRLSGATFRYVIDSPTMGASRLEFTKIKGESDSISNTPALVNRLTHSTLSGMTQTVAQGGQDPAEPQPSKIRPFKARNDAAADERHTANQNGIDANLKNQVAQNVELEIRANYLIQPFRADVKLAVQHQSLEPIGAFLNKNDGIKLVGDIQQAVAKISVRDHQVHGTFHSDYRDLKVMISKTPERSSLAASIMQLAVKLAVHKESEKRARANEARDKEIERHQKLNESHNQSQNQSKMVSITDAQSKRGTGTSYSEFRTVEGESEEISEQPAQDSHGNGERQGDSSNFSVEFQRENNESVVHSIIRALKEMAIQSVVRVPVTKS